MEMEMESEVPHHVPTVEINPDGLTDERAAELLLIHGPNKLPEKIVPKWLIFCRLLIQPMPIMLWLASAVEGAIQQFPDMGILLGIQFANASIAFYEITKAGDAVAALKASLKPTATVKRNGRWVGQFNAEFLVPGDLVTLNSGAAVPADCIINHGEIEVDQSAMTGESLPVTMYTGDSAKMGSTVTRGEVEATVEFTGEKTFFGKTASMLQSDDDGTDQGGLKKLLLTIMLTLTLVSLALCSCCLGYLLGKGESISSALSFTVVLLVASIPLAMEIVTTTTLALGSRGLALQGAIVSRLSAIEDLAGMDMLCSDKTGTLTLNRMELQAETPFFVDDLDQHGLLRYAAMAAKWREPAKDALDKLVLGCADLPSLEHVVQTEYMPFSAETKRTEGTVIENGCTFKVTKGAPHVIAKLESQDSPRVHKLHEEVDRLGKRGIRALAVARTNFGPNGSDSEWALLGLLTFLDPPRPDTKHTIDTCKQFGVPVKMITGDSKLIAKETARVLGLGQHIKSPKGLPMLGEGGSIPPNLAQHYGKSITRADGFAQVFPEHKFLIVQTLIDCGFKVGMTGDGVNDAPALKKASVGVAVSGATDAARAAADIVLTEEGLSTILTGITVAREIFGRMKNFLQYRIAATLQLVVFFFIAVLTLHPSDFVPSPLPASWPDVGVAWPSFFEMPVLMLMLITLLNDGTLISIGYDNVKPSKIPEVWNLKVLFFISGVLGCVACGSSLLLLWGALDSWNANGWFGSWGIPGLSYGQVTTLVYLKVSVSDFLSLFCARTDSWFWSSRPSWILLIAGGCSLLVSTILAATWPQGTLDGIPVQGMALRAPAALFIWVWMYCLFWWFVQDALKVLAFWVLRRYNFFDVNNVSGHARASAASEGRVCEMGTTAGGEAPSRNQVAPLLDHPHSWDMPSIAEPPVAEATLKESVAARV